MGLQKFLHHILSPCDLIDAVLLNAVLVIDILKESFILWAIGKYFENVSIDAA